MTATVNIINPLVGPTHFLMEPDVSNWVDVIDDITTDPCTFEVHYDGETFTGTIAKSMDGTTLQIAFIDDLIALPSGMCLLVTCLGGGVVDNGCAPDQIIDLNQVIRLMAVDDEGCPLGYVTLQDLIDHITTQLNIPTSLCDLLIDGIPPGNLTAQDRIVTTTGDPACTLKSVPQSQVVCP